MPETSAPHQCNRRRIAGLYVGFETVEFDCFERIAKHELQRFRQVALIGKGRANIVAEISTAERPVEDLMQHDRANDSVILVAADEKTD